MSRSVLGIGEGFDLFVNRIRYVAYFLIYNIGLTIIAFLTSFFYFAQKDSNIMFVLKYSIKYGFYNLKLWLFEGLVKNQKLPFDYGFAQDVYRKHFSLIFHTYAFYYSIGISLLIFSITFFLVYRYTKKLANKHTIRGTKIKNLGRVKELSKFIKPKDEVKHTVIIGTTGSGKTQSLLNLMKKKITEGKNVIFDAKGDFLPRFFRKGVDIILNPLDIRSHRWNFLEEVEDIADLETLSQSLIQKPRGSINQTSDYFIKNAQQILFMLLQHLLEKGVLDNSKVREAIMDEVFYKTDSSLLSDFKKDLNLGSNVSLADTLSTLRVHLSFAKAIGYEPDVNPKFHIKEWISSDENRNIYITYDFSKSPITEGFYSAFLNMLLLRLSSMPDASNANNAKIRIWVDELANLPTIPNLGEALSYVRSKGVAFYLSTQSLEGLKRRYRIFEITDILNNCNTMISFAANDSFTAETISKLIGQTQIELPNKNHFSSPKISKIDGINLHRERKTEVAVLPSEIMALEDLEFYAKFSRRWYKGKLKYINIPKNDIEFFIKNTSFNLNADSRNHNKENKNNEDPKPSITRPDDNKISKEKDNPKDENKDSKKPNQNPLDMADKFME